MDFHFPDPVTAVTTESPFVNSAWTCVSPSVLCPGSSKCISKNQLCDRRRDCPDGFDENNCVVECRNAGESYSQNKMNRWHLTAVLLVTLKTLLAVVHLCIDSSLLLLLRVRWLLVHWWDSMHSENWSVWWSCSLSWWLRWEAVSRHRFYCFP